ncbi:MAG: hypothetical protein IJ491_02000 [Clostridia bacterium]|nr:hypothetical protein [Clostridia bacterium]
MAKNLIQITTDGTIGKVIHNGQDISSTVTGVDIKIRAAELPKVTIIHRTTALDIELKDFTVKELPDSSEK